MRKAQTMRDPTLSKDSPVALRQGEPSIHRVHRDRSNRTRSRRNACVRRNADLVAGIDDAVTIQVIPHGDAKCPVPPNIGDADVPLVATGTPAGNVASRNFGLFVLPVEYANATSCAVPAFCTAARYTPRCRERATPMRGRR